MIQDYERSNRPSHLAVLRETLACVAWGALYPFGIKESRKRTARREEQRTTVFVHGYFANPASFFPLVTYLRTIGRGPALSFRYRPGTSIERAARELRDFLRTRVRGGRIDLVCHSLGGVVARVYLQDLGGHRRVDRCITLGTPHRGTYNSYWVATHVGGGLRPDSALMKRLEKSRSAAASVKFASIVGGADNIVIPRVFGSYDDDTIVIPDVGHMGLLFSPRTFFEVGRSLR